MDDFLANVAQSLTTRPRTAAFASTVLSTTPLFPRSGPGEFGSPMSAVILRCYDFPARIPGHLFVSLPGSTLPSAVRVSQLALAKTRTTESGSD